MSGYSVEHTWVRAWKTLEFQLVHQASLRTSSYQILLALGQVRFYSPGRNLLVPDGLMALFWALTTPESWSKHIPGQPNSCTLINVLMYTVLCSQICFYNLQLYPFSVKFCTWPLANISSKTEIFSSKHLVILYVTKILKVPWLSPFNKSVLLLL